MAKADPKFSEGARYERRTILARVRRQRNAIGSQPSALTAGSGAIFALDALVVYLTTRQQRYDRKSGGLGR